MGRIVTKAEVGASILAGVVLCVRCAQTNGGTVDHIRGVMALAEHSAITFGLGWPAMLGEARQALGSDVGKLIDQALTLDVGNRGL